MKKILIVDDEFEMRQLLRIYLLQDNYQVDESDNGQDAFEKVKKDDYDLMILDVMMPIMDGWRTLEEVRKISNIPIIMLTAKGSIQDKVTGLSSGADDYLVKPFDEAELLARVNALLRRAHNQEENMDQHEVLKYEGVILNLTAREVTYENQKLNLTPTEFDLLEIFIRHRGKALSREQLVEHIWGLEFMGEDRTVDVHVKNLRLKLKASGIDKLSIKTVWGIGYKVE
ncbi:response regulator transcription factor [Niallia sp. Sow4_A1]|uniref:Response regulator transcription factor n=1 Tax=Niallia hominis TaxID=3133173 RepID=A0ABV1F757_9BACI|nr:MULTISPECIES: response regulator transcription factor [Bacillaceae]MCM3365027.1 response regulator transcription factor [Niallia sp. MER TA 168]